MEREKRLPIPELLIIMGTVGGLVTYYFERYRQIDMDAAVIVGLIVAASALCGQFIQYKRHSMKSAHAGSKAGGADSKIEGINSKIEGMNSKVESVGRKVNEMIIELGYISENVKKIRDEVVETLVPGMEHIKGIDLLVEELNYQKRVKGDVSGGIAKPDYILNGIQSVYERNAQLELLLKERGNEVERLSLENVKLNRSILELKRSLQAYQKPVRHRDEPEQ